MGGGKRDACCWLGIRGGAASACGAQGPLGRRCASRLLPPAAHPAASPPVAIAPRVDGLRARLGKGGGGDARAEASLRAALEELRHKEGKQAATAQGYAEAEAGLARDLSTLVADARWLRHYCAWQGGVGVAGLRKASTCVVPVGLVFSACVCALCPTRSCLPPRLGAAAALALRLEGGALQRVADFITPAAAPAPPPARQLAAAAAHPAQLPLPDSAGGWGLAVGASMPGPGTPGMAAEAGTWRGATL